MVSVTAFTRKPEEAIGTFAQGRIIVMLDRGNEWQIGYIIPKGAYQEIRTAGLAQLKNSLVEVVPQLSNQLDHLQSWSQVAFLSVKSDLVNRWYCPGLLLVGDAAHIMSPVGGVGINYAIQDAVVAANLLSQPLKNHNLNLSHLAKVQLHREIPTKIIQTLQTFIQKQVFAKVLHNHQEIRPPWFIKIPFLRSLLARLIAFGIFPVHVQN